VDLQSDQVWITSQNHGFAVADPDAGMLAAHPLAIESQEVENLHGNQVVVRYVNANDRTVEGLDIVGAPAFSVQFHPEACPGPHDAHALFARFKEMVESHIQGGV
jgi:carbamoyl-phosphate synthase small subunit